MYTQKQLIGKGTFGDVWHFTQNSTGIHVAIKIILIKDNSDMEF